VPKSLRLSLLYAFLTRPKQFAREWMEVQQELSAVKKALEISQKPPPREPVFPPEFDAKFYGSAYLDLRNFTDVQLEAHYKQYGASEGRFPNRLRNRDEFIKEISSSVSTLEIGPFFSPIAIGENVKYFDVLTQEKLLERGRKIDPDANPPFVDYVSPNGDLSIVDRTFDLVVSSYCLEHQPDLIKHLRDVSSILNPGGCYVALAPDKRYCHDHFMAESTIAGVLDAYHTGRATHSLRSVVERALIAHNDHVRHWNGDHGEQFEDLEARIKRQLSIHEQAQGGYVDVHSWYFTPDSARHILATLNGMNYIELECIRCYDTRKNQNDFWLVLQKPYSDNARG
jgi:SAM-dependent methyltransferase